MNSYAKKNNEYFTEHFEYYFVAVYIFIIKSDILNNLLVTIKICFILTKRGQHFLTRGMKKYS